MSTSPEAPKSEDEIGDELAELCAKHEISYSQLRERVRILEDRGEECEFCFEKWPPGHCRTIERDYGGDSVYTDVICQACDAAGRTYETF
jgi:hypothetical protein